MLSYEIHTSLLTSRHMNFRVLRQHVLDLVPSLPMLSETPIFPEFSVRG
jgi:hypothetical protein